MKLRLLAKGIVVILASVWIGAYALNEYPAGTWQSFPTFFTAFVAFMFGLGMSFYAGVKA